ncbi:MAG: alkaline phosphatase family protein [Bacteroidetes bacterium]|nr:alkaline phosphatase family protein [Bacteroidota bacterium]
MKKYFLILIALFIGLNSWSQSNTPARPKLVVGIILDQMRWDYLYRYQNRYAADGGFKRLLNQGATCENTFIPYTPTVTACGHASVYTGSVPSINGITGNAWWDQDKQATVYCTDDKTVKTVGSDNTSGLMSPRNLLTNTIGDELRMATQFRSKVVGIALKDRGAILPAGHSANAAYWYDSKTGNWVTSTYYRNELPNWVKQYNDSKRPDAFYQMGWNTLYPANTYTASTDDEKSYENPMFGKKLPYDLSAYIGKDYSKILTTPHGNSLTFEFAKKALLADTLGKDPITDLLAISFSSPDYIGHSYGPNSVEAEDGFLRMDRELGEFLRFLDKEVGAGQYTVFLSADHGAAPVPEYMQENKMPGGRVFFMGLINQINQSLQKEYLIANLIVSDDNYQIHLNRKALDSAKIDRKSVSEKIMQWIRLEPGVDRIFPLEELNTIPLNEKVRNMLNNGYHPLRSGDLQIILKSNYIDAYGKTGTTHGLWNPYDSHIPLLWYGWGIRPGRVIRETYMTDIAPTLASLLRIQMPSGSIGKAIPEVIK